MRYKPDKFIPGIVSVLLGLGCASTGSSRNVAPVPQVSELVKEPTVYERVEAGECGCWVKVESSGNYSLDRRTTVALLRTNECIRGSTAFEGRDYHIFVDPRTGDFYGFTDGSCAE
ncbi:hypothetical protein ACFL0X_01075 [Nanoarchaeota archaeon]